MDTAAGRFLALTALWAAVALAVQAGRVAARHHRPHASRAGDPGRAILYNFTVTMLPSHKESASRHPISFSAGILLHAAVFASLTAAFVSLLSPPRFDLARPVIAWTAAIGVLACAFLVLRRILSRELRAISVPDDFAAAVAVGLFLAATAATALGRFPVPSLQVLTGLLLLYVPLGKLRHAVFFFLARADLGRRLGWRGVYPPPARTGIHG
jgi:hypothetical protein